MPLASIPSPSQGVWNLGPLPIRAYALCIVLGVIVAVWIGERRWRARGGQPGTITDIAVWAVPFGLVGGRLYHVITDWQLYFGAEARNEPIDVLFIWKGGLGIWGAVALGAVGVWIACRRRGISFTAVADTLAPAVAVGQAIGRWGNYFNQELFGSPCDYAWCLEISPGQPGAIPDVATYHPAFLYESLWTLALAGVLILLGRRFTLTHGRLFALYVAGYTVGRFWIEGLRIDEAHQFLGLRLNQWTSIVIFVLAVAYFVWARKKDTPEIVDRAPADDGPIDTLDVGAEGTDPAHGPEQADETERSSTSSAKPVASDEPSTTVKAAEPATSDEPGTTVKAAEPVASDEPGTTVKVAEPVASDEPGTTVKVAKPVASDEPNATGKAAEPSEEEARQR